MSGSSPNSYSGPHIESGPQNYSNAESVQENNNISGPQGYIHDYSNPGNVYPNGEQATQSAMDARSIYVGQVDYGTSPEELQAFFQPCGTINRVTILCDKYTGHPKGYGFIEFAEETSANHALSLDQSTFRGRQLKVTPKRTNVPFIPTRGRGRGRGGSNRGQFIGGNGRGYAPSSLPHPPLPPYSQYYNGPGAPMHPLPPGYYSSYQ